MGLVEDFNAWLGNAEGWLWTWLGMPVVGLLALYFTLRTGAVQFRMLPAMFQSIRENPQSDEGAKHDTK
ncbi:hypothetical protein [Brevibacterium jeotgali]|nr:hypothetical protein [Brevibacterium jeotgali]